MATRSLTLIKEALQPVVVDASIRPDLSTGNTQAMVMVVVEKVAERILAPSTRSNSTAGANSASSATSPVITLPGGTGDSLSTGAASSVFAVPTTLDIVSSKAAALTPQPNAIRCLQRPDRPHHGPLRNIPRWVKDENVDYRLEASR